MISTRFMTAWIITFVTLLNGSLVLAASAPSVRFVRAITESGGEALFRDPLQMSLNQETGEVAVTNAGTGDVVILRIRDEKVLLRIGRRQGLHSPFGIVLDADKTLLAGALKGGKVQRRGPTGVLLKTWDLTAELGHPVRPGRIRSGGPGTTLIMDRRNDEVLIMNQNGTVRTVVGGPKKLEEVQDALWGPNNRLYVLCDGPQPVKVFSRAGKFLFGFGKHSDAPENFSFPCALRFDAKGRLWIVDAFQHKLKVFTAKGTFLFQIGGIGTNPDQFFFPNDLAFDGQGRLWVLEKGTNRIKIYEVEDLKK